MIVGNFLRADRSRTPPAEFALFSAAGGYPLLLSYWSPRISRHQRLVPFLLGQRAKSVLFNITPTMPTNTLHCLLSGLLAIRLVSQESVLKRVDTGLWFIGCSNQW